MNKDLLFTVVAVILLSVLRVASCGKKIKVNSYQDYIKHAHKALPKISSMVKAYQDEESQARIRDALKQMAESENFNRGDIQARLQVFIEASSNPKYTPESRDVFNEISLLHEEISCDIEQLSLIQSTLAQMQVVEIPLDMKLTLRLIFRKSLQNCSLREAERRELIDPEVAEQLDKVFAAALDMTYAYDDKLFEFELASRLDGFDMALDEFNVGSMLAAIKGLSYYGSMNNVKPFDLLRNFMMVKCLTFKNSFKVKLALWDLGREFGLGTFGQNPDMRRMNEYKRICSALASPSKQDAIGENFARQLAREAPEGVPVSA